MDSLLLHGFSTSTGTDKLIANREGVFKVYNATTGVWDNVASPTMNAANLIQATNFLDYAFFVNYLTNVSYDGTTWSTSTNMGDMPLGKYIENQDLRVFLGNIKIRGNAFTSRVAYSDLPKNNAIVWGFETGSDLAQTASSAVITSAGSLFKTRGIKVGDKIFIESGTNAGEYTVRSVDSETQLTLTQALTNTQSSCNFWVGGNWFDVKTNDGDFIMGFGRNSNELLIFKRNSLHRYNATAKFLRQVKNVKGTTSTLSIVNKDEYTYYFYPKEGILRYDGVTSSPISNALDDIIDGISESMYTNVVGWATNDSVEFYVGNVTLRDGDTISNCVVSFEIDSQNWSVRSLPWAIENKTTWYQNNVPNTYIINNHGQVLKVNDGYDYAGIAMSFQMEDRPVFPEGPDTLVDFTKLRLFIEKGREVQVLYKLHYHPVDNDPRRWEIDQDWKPLRGKANGDKVEFIFDPEKDHRACGIQFKFVQASSNQSFLLEKYILFYSNPSLI